MWRDRTNLYISYRQSFTHHPAKKPRYIGASNGFTDIGSQSEESRRLISESTGIDDDGDAIIEMDVLPPRWVDVQEEVTELLEDIAQKSAQLDKLHHKHLLPGFGDEDVRKQDERVIERYTQDITRGFHECQKLVQRIELMVHEAKQQGGVSSGDETMAKNIQISLASRVQDASARFRKKQSTYLRKLRGLEDSASQFDRSPTPVQNSYTDPSLMESDADKSFSQTTLMQTTQRMTGQNDAVILQREREINDIAKGIIELSDIFRELQTMVIDQGTMLDRIDYNVERMHTDVQSAQKELNVATNYQRRTTKRKVILLLILLVVGMIIVLLVKPKRHSSSEPAPPSSPPPSQPDNNPLNMVPRESGIAYRRSASSSFSRVAKSKWVEPDIYR
ncbi:Putative SNARE protein TLG2/Syntaxin 16 [Aspergillus calidoustus]|uniref:Putative SNARE protein TLG2/Syntaxin 16 n=1 Tax=Aspergillus calidoustus TaxID=454130 RepID=A0A0U5G4C9_ASPCI|nr:Putative SNARE protein TLG2/Syntaxin 16 [Aspergillus calidoustus]